MIAAIAQRSKKAGHRGSGDAAGDRPPVPLLHPVSIIIYPLWRRLGRARILGVESMLARSFFELWRRGFRMLRRYSSVDFPTFSPDRQRRRKADPQHNRRVVLFAHHRSEATNKLHLLTDL